jgi:GT2 family glycosyltransferase
MDGSLAYAGTVRALGKDALSRYYETQRILEPPPDESGRPRYLVTANALVWREAFERVGGFREDFTIAAGEDVDLALRLREVGTLAYASQATVLHDFEPDPVAFWKRFERYGVGNRQVEQFHGLDLSPRPFPPNEESAFNWVAASIQYLAMAKGYAQVNGRSAT